MRLSSLWLRPALRVRAQAQMNRNSGSEKAVSTEDLLTKWRVHGGFLGGSALKNLPIVKRPEFDPWVQKIPWRKEWQPTPVLLLENPMNKGAWKATVHGVTKESNTTEHTQRLHGITRL